MNFFFSLHNITTLAAYSMLFTFLQEVKCAISGLNGYLVPRAIPLKGKVLETRSAWMPAGSLRNYFDTVQTLENRNFIDYNLTIFTRMLSALNLQKIRILSLDRKKVKKYTHELEKRFLMRSWIHGRQLHVDMF